MAAKGNLYLDLNERQEEAANKCLDCFIRKGFFATTSRDLSDALNLQSGGIYYYFKSKDDIVSACTEMAAIRLEINLIVPAFFELNDPNLLFENLFKRADEMAPTMCFLTSVCSTEKYKPMAQSVLSMLSKRYRLYAEKLAERFRCEITEIEPYFYIGISAMANYMIFGTDRHIDMQMQILKKKVTELVNNGEGEKSEWLST